MPSNKTSRRRSLPPILAVLSLLACSRAAPPDAPQAIRQGLQGTIPAAGGTVSGTTAGTSAFSSDCSEGTSGAPEHVYAWTPAVSGVATVSTCGAGTTYDTVLYVRTALDAPDPPAACNDDDNAGCSISEGRLWGSRIKVPVTAGHTYYIFVDGYFDPEHHDERHHGNYTLTVEPPPVIPPAGGVIIGTTAGTGPGIFRPSEFPSEPVDRPEKVYTWTPSRSGDATIHTCGPNTHFDTSVYVATGNDGSGQFVYNDDADSHDCLISTGDAFGSRLTVPVTAGTPYYIYVDTWDPSVRDQFSLTVVPPGGAEVTIDTAPQPGSTPYRGQICILDSDCKAGTEAQPKVTFVVPSGSHRVLAQWTTPLSGTSFDLIPDTQPLTVEANGHVSLDPRLAPYFVQDPSDSTKLALRTRKVTLDFKGYIGGLIGYYWEVFNGPGQSSFYLLANRRYWFTTTWAKSLDQPDNAQDWGVTVNDLDAPPGTPELVLSDETNQWLKYESGTLLSARAVDVTLALRGHPIAIGLRGVNGANPPGGTVRLLAGRRYDFWSPYSWQLDSDIDSYSTDFGFRVETEDQHRISLDEQTAAHFDADGMTVTAKVAQVTIDTSGHSGNVCLTGVGCAAIPRAMQLIVGRRYQIDGAGGGKFSVLADGTCPDPGLTVNGSPVHLTCMRQLETTQINVQRLVGAVPIPVPAAQVDILRGNTPLNSVTTDQNGVVAVILPEGGPVRFHTEWGGAQFFSSAVEDCSPASCPNKTITVTGVDVTVVKPGYVPVPSAMVSAYTGTTWSTLAGAGTTGADGIARVGLPPGTYKFQTVDGGKAYWSAVECTVAGCSTAIIKVGDECFDVEDASNTACNSADLCNTFVCRSHACALQAPKPVEDDHNACTADACDPQTGFTHTPRPEGFVCEVDSGGAAKKTCQHGTCLPDMSSYEAHPTPPPISAEPQVGDRFFGVLKGQFGVTPTGAATYTLPISIPPGIAGMAPNLSLVYNSQGGDGIAGQGWDLTGLSVIHICPKTKVQDGAAEPIGGGGPYGPDTDAYCLDGKRLKSGPDGLYTELEEFSRIPRGGTVGFRVVTKSGEIRFYGSREDTQVAVYPSETPRIGVWLLDKVMDPWGNYFEVHYNHDEGHHLLADGSKTRFQSEGIMVTSISYTGHASTPPFHTITFLYENRDRSDIRQVRLGPLTLPRRKRLEKIITPRGMYTLIYADEDQTHMLPSLLTTIRYCADAQCLPDLTFDWTGGNYGWERADGLQDRPDYRLPMRIDRPIDTLSPPRTLSRGTQIVDLDGDGRPDFLVAKEGEPRQVWQNRAGRFLPAPSSWTLRTDLVKSDGTPGRARLADMDGDGLLDIVANPASGGGGEPPPQVWLNRLNTASPRWELANFAVDPLAPSIWQTIDLSDTTKFMITDMNGDGRMDLVRFGPTNSRFVNVVLNLPSGDPNVPGRWTPATLNYDFTSSNYPGANLGTVAECTLFDVNRDGLADAVCKDVTALNTGRSVGLNDTVWGLAYKDTGLPVVASGARSFGDIDGDGLYDALTIHPLIQNHVCSGADGNDCASFYNEPNGRTAHAQLGVEFIPSFAFHLSKLQEYLPKLPLVSVPDSDSNRFKIPRDYVFSMADMNADGLVDIVLNHHDGGGQLLVNTGETWVDLLGRNGRQESGGPPETAVPAVPADHLIDGYPGDSTVAAAYVDLNGDGVTDVVRTHMDGTTLVSEAWLNKFTPPVIKGFPNGLARETEVKYAVISTGNSYSDSGVREHGSTFLMVPLRVVEQVSGEDGTGTGTASTQTYTYSDLRGSATGRGPQGFRAVNVYDSASSTTTTTTYALAYPYTGMVTTVSRRVEGPLLPGPTITETTTDYCDRNTDDPTNCTPLAGPANGEAYADPGRGVFVHPMKVTDKSFLYGEMGSRDPSLAVLMKTIITTTEYRYDDHGNPLRTTVTIDNGEEKHSTETVSTYGPAGSVYERMGKVRSTTVKSTQLFPADVNNPPITHSTTFDYQSKNSIDVTVLEKVEAIALTKTKVEEGAGWPIELHTAYAYDEFGNVTITTSCQRDFPGCEAGAASPGATDPSDPRYRDASYRTTRTSYNPDDFAPAKLGGPILYGVGRFPVKTTVVLEGPIPGDQSEYFIYNPTVGLPIQHTDVNGIHTCYEYDPFGARTSETARCGTQPLVTTALQYRAAPTNGIAPPGTAVVTVTRAPTGAATWAYADVLGRSKKTLVRAFGGGFIETSSTTYDVVGRVGKQSKPRFDTGVDAVYETSFAYDPAGRLTTVNQDLGNIDFAGPANVQDTTTHIPRGLSIVTLRTVNGRPQARIEVKNVLGKVARVVDSNSHVIAYTYDPDGNLTDACNDTIPCTAQKTENTVHLAYDQRGRKIVSVDTDMGKWTYGYNGFGDLVSQTDARKQTVEMTYDQLGRMTTKRDVDTGGTAEWVYDRAAGGVGKLAAMVSAPDPKLEGPCTVPHVTVSGGNRTGRWFTYTAFGEVQDASECTDGSTFVTSYGYDDFGRQSIVRYPEVKGTRLSVRYNYTATTGYLHYVDDADDGRVYWAALAMNALGQVTRERTRNGVETGALRNPATGWLMISASTALADDDRRIQDWMYTYDEAGNLRRRKRADDAFPGPTNETFGYDDLNRLTSSRVEIASPFYDATESYDYDAIGNFITKGGKSYSYTGCMAGGRAAGLHAVCRVDNGPLFAYDANGSLTSGSGRSISYNAAHKPDHMEANGAIVDFVYGADGNRVIQNVSASGATARTLYVGLGPTGKSTYERTTRGGIVEHVQFLYAGGAHGGNAFALRVLTESGSQIVDTQMKYYHFDHLGSVTAMSDAAGRVVGDQVGGADASVLGYDPWGARRKASGQAASPSEFNQQVGRREYTGHETIPSVGLINMNGRVYDPVLGRFLSPDPNVQFVADLQSYNRYSYVLNNPLRNTDPTGYLSNGDLDTIVHVGLFVGGLACSIAVGPACGTAFGIIGALYDSTSALAAGATVDQVTISNAISVGAALIGGAATGGIANGVAAQIIGGAISGGISAALWTWYSGGSLGENVAWGAVRGATQAAFSVVATGIVLSLGEAAYLRAPRGFFQGMRQACFNLALGQLSPSTFRENPLLVWDNGVARINPYWQAVISPFFEGRPVDLDIAIEFMPMGPIAMYDHWHRIIDIDIDFARSSFTPYGVTGDNHLLMALVHELAHSSQHLSLGTLSYLSQRLVNKLDEMFMSEDEIYFTGTSGLDDWKTVNLTTRNLRMEQSAQVFAASVINDLFHCDGPCK